jgi:DNA-binding GntR family transcriptional regulator
MTLRTRRALAEQVRLKLRQLLDEGAYPPGSRLPNEEDLSEQLGVSRTTLREALQSLEQEGLIFRRHGHGTFVNQRPLQLKNSLDRNFGVTDLIRETGHVPGTRGLLIGKKTADAQTAESLDLPPQAEVLHIERVRLADNRPVIFSIDLLPLSLLGNVSEAINELQTGSLYQFVNQHLGLVIHHGLAQLKPLTAESWLARKLELPPGSVVLYLEQVDYTLDQRPVLLSQEYHVPNAFEFSIYRRGPG